MTKLLRAAFFAALVLGLLSSLTYLVYLLPSQLERRAAGTLGACFATPVQVRGAAQEWMGPLVLRRVVVPALPVLEERDLLVAEDVQIQAAADEGPTLTLLAGRPADGLSARARLVELNLEHELAPEGGLVSGSRWNFLRALRGAEPFAEAARSGHRLWVEELRLRLAEIRPRQEKSLVSASVEDLTVDGLPDGSIELRGDLGANAFFSEGQLRLRIWPQAAPGHAATTVEGEATLEDLQGAAGWISLLIPEYGRMEKLLGAQGPVELVLTGLRFDLGGGAPDYRAAVRHYDTLLRLPGGIEVRHVRGGLVYTPGAAVIGEEKLGRLSGELWGIEVELSGRAGPADAELKLRLPRTEIRAGAAAGMPGAMAALWRRLSPSGALAGELDLRFSGDALRGWSAHLDFQDLAFEGQSLLGPGSGRLSAESEAGKGRGTLVITSLNLEPFGSVEGQVPFTLVDGEVTAEPSGVDIGGGGLYGKVVRTGGGVVRGNLRWDSSTFSFAGGLLSAKSVEGRIDLVPQDDQLGGTIRLELKDVTLRVDRIPHSDFPLGDEESLGFSMGEIAGTLGPAGVPRLDLVLRGERGSLRFSGTLLYRGGIDAVAVLAIGEAGRALGALGLSSNPAEWRRATEGRGLALRVRGDSSRARVRRVDWSDPVFQPPAGAAPPAPPAAPGPSPPSK